MTYVQKFRRASLRREKSIAADLGGKVTPGSGNVNSPYLKEDVHARMFVVQSKATLKKSYSLKAADFATCLASAQRVRKLPAFKIEMDGEELAVIRWCDFVQMVLDAKYA